MPIRSHITDPESGQQAKVLDNGEVLVSLYTCPPLLPQKNKVFSQFLTDDGTTSGSEDLGVTGSATNVNYWVPADGEDDIYIARVSFLVGYGSSAEGYEFADKGGALANGVRIFYVDTEGDEIEILNYQKNSDLWRLSDTRFATAWEIRHLAVNGDYGFLVGIDLMKLVPPYGVKLDRGTSQKITVAIRDDCTDADDFNCKAFGFKRFE